MELGRYGGDEFALIAPGLSTVEAVELADRLRTAVPFHISASAGVAAWVPGDGPASVLHRADVALYEAKGSGRGRTVNHAVGA